MHCERVKLFSAFQRFNNDMADKRNGGNIVNPLLVIS
jgi:hypothetical protein